MRDPVTAHNYFLSKEAAVSFATSRQNEVKCVTTHHPSSRMKDKDTGKPLTVYQVDVSHKKIYEALA